MGANQLLDRINDLPEFARRQLSSYLDFLQARYGKSSELNDFFFWAVIDSGTDIISMSNALAEYSIDHIYYFQDTLAKKLSLLDTPAHYQTLATNEEGGSADSFLYARCAVVSSGQNDYEQLLDEPSKFPFGADAEWLLAVPSMAYEIKTGSALKRLPATNYESFFNRDSWGPQAISI